MKTKIFMSRLRINNVLRKQKWEWNKSSYFRVKLKRIKFGL